MANFVQKNQRKHMLFIPADKPAMYRDAILYKADTLMFDLEDAVAYQEKDAARQLLIEVLNDIDYNAHGIETCVRINGVDTEFYEKDIEACVKAKVNMIRIPKAETIEEIEEIENVLKKYEQKYELNYEIKFFIAIESAKGVLNAYEIGSSSKRIVGIALGGVDYLLDMKANKLPNREELLYARQHLVHVARALKIDAFDVIYPNTADAEGFIKEFKFIKSLGFNGKSVIHPNQITLINEIYKPSQAELEFALEMKEAFDENIKQGKGVFLFKGQMVDKPVVDKQLEIIALAKEFEMLSDK
ncbi:aldolase/citrate lyase family protein [Spiroplasma culicicola]|uniref:Citrate lyase subunit beta n=1 Tax=Spiroplasma culicicola AES-1 TaxID=1276246 RepID=W6A6K9_9MOLU|nr:aldolase/citrate lyase family protein [Spiroplasma culicicola]AHI52510.1 citrate lyase subunit beta [Spiroplasma culicicola AES-1]